MDERNGQLRVCKVDDGYQREQQRDMVSTLRAVDETKRISAALALLGAVLVAFGLFWGTLHVLVGNPFLMPIGGGLACLGVAAASKREGLLAYAPQGVQEFLVNRNMFDLCFDDTGMVKGIRRWGRILMLCQERTPEEVEHITKGLDPEFLDWVFKKPLIKSVMPAGISRIALPETAKDAPSEQLGRLAEQSSSSSSNITSDEIAAVIKSRVDEREQVLKSGEPEILPMVFGMFTMKVDNIGRNLRCAAFCSAATAGIAAVLGYGGLRTWAGGPGAHWLAALPGWLALPQHELVSSRAQPAARHLGLAAVVLMALGTVPLLNRR